MNPPALENKPNLPIFLRHYLSSFYVLSSRRSTGFGIDPIGLQDIYVYLCMYPWYDHDEFIKLIIDMDSVFLEHHRGEQEVSS